MSHSRGKQRRSALPPRETCPPRQSTITSQTNLAFGLRSFLTAGEWLACAWQRHRSVQKSAHVAWRNAEYFRIAASYTWYRCSGARIHWDAEAHIATRDLRGPIGPRQADLCENRRNGWCVCAFCLSRRLVGFGRACCISPGACAVYICDVLSSACRRRGDGALEEGVAGTASRAGH